jgi:hypothetical protein
MLPIVGEPETRRRGLGGQRRRDARRPRAPAAGAPAPRVAVAQGAKTLGQQVRARAREACPGLLHLGAPWWAQGHWYAHIWAVWMPADTRQRARPRAMVVSKS